MSHQTNRREFIQASTVAGLGVWVAGRGAWAAENGSGADSKSPNEIVNTASIGVGGKGDSDSEHVATLGNIVAICDVDEKRLGSKHEKLKKEEKYKGKEIKTFTDFRKMLDEVKEIEAVTISTPDHTHAVATMMAIKMGKHVYTQKPLAHDVYEARQLRLAAKEHKIASQMGNQGTASDKLREGVELIQAGILGDISEVHIWTNRPIWPQSPKIKERPPEAPVPEYLHWDEWLGTAPKRPYAATYYHSFNWRGWLDFGTGALGDMGCHTANLPFMALKLGYPTSMQGASEALNSETYPAWAKVNFEFPARGSMPPVKVTWYEGRKDDVLVHPPAELVEKVLKLADVKPNKQGKIELNNSGSIIVGSKGMLYSPHDYGGAWILLPKEDFKNYKAPAQTLPRNKDGGDLGQKAEWLAAVKGGPAALANFDYAGLLAEFILLGNVAIKAEGKKLEWDGPNMKIPNVPEAEKFLKRTYRGPWSL